MGDGEEMEAERRGMWGREKGMGGGGDREGSRGNIGEIQVGLTWE